MNSNGEGKKIKLVSQGIKRCYYCDKPTVIGNFCSECGDILGRTYVTLPYVTCSHCKEEVPDRAYCISCGKDLEADSNSDIILNNVLKNIGNKDEYKEDNYEPELLYSTGEKNSKKIKTFKHIKICSSCRKSTVAGNFCGECGEILGILCVKLPYITCPYCNDEVPDRKYCISCGKYVNIDFSLIEDIKNNED